MAFLQFDINMTSPLGVDFTTKHPEIDVSFLPDYISYADDSEHSWSFASEYVSSFRPLSLQDIAKRRLTPPWNMRGRLVVAFASRLPTEIVDVICSFIDCPYRCDWVRMKRDTPGDPTSSVVPDTGIWEICVTDPEWASHLFEMNHGRFGDPFGGRQAGRFRPTRLSLSYAAMLRSRYYRQSGLADLDDSMSDIRERARLVRPLCLFGRSCVGSASEEHFVKFRHFDDDALEGSLPVALPTRILDAVLARGGSTVPVSMVPMVLAHNADAASRIGANPVMAFGCVCHFPVDQLYFLQGDTLRDGEEVVPFGFLLSGGCGPSQQEKIAKRRAFLKNELLDHDGCPEFVKSHPEKYHLLAHGPTLAVFAVRNGSEATLPGLEFPILLHYWLWGRCETIPLFRFLLRLCDYVPMEAFERFSSVTSAVVIREIQQEGAGLWGEIAERIRQKWDSLLEEEQRRFKEFEWWGEAGSGLMRPADFRGALADLLETSSRRE